MHAKERRRMNPYSENNTADRREIRSITSRVFFGMDLYLLVFTGLQMVMYVEYLIAAMFMEGVLPEEPSDAVMGMIILASTFAGVVITWLYFARQNAYGRLYGGEPFTRTMFGRRKAFSLKTIGQCMALIFVIQVGFSFIQDLLEMLFNRFGQTLQYSEALNADYSASIPLLLYATLVGPVAEELVYRGFIMRGLERHGRWFAIIMSSLIFGLMHGDLQQSLFTIGAGLVFGYVAMEYSLKDSILLHIFNNAVLGELWPKLIEGLSDTAYVIIVLAILILCAAVCIRMLKGAFRNIREYREAYPTVKYAWGSIWNIWFLIFLAYTVYEIVYSVQPLQ